MCVCVCHCILPVVCVIHYVSPVFLINCHGILCELLCCCCWSLLHSTILHSQADSLHSHVILNEWLTSNSAFFNIHQSGILTVLVVCYMACAMWNFYHLSMFYIHHTTMHHHFMQSHICRMHASLAVNCPLHFWQNDCDLLNATVVTQGWNGCWNKGQHWKMTLEKKIILLLLPGLKPATFQLQVQHSNHWAIPVVFF